MPETREIVINTGPLIALVAAVGNLRILETLYTRVIVPFKVTREILACASSRFAATEFNASSWIEKRQSPIAVGSSLRNTLGIGERGGSAEEVEQAIRHGTWARASRGKWHTTHTFAYNQPSPVNGQRYASKKIDAVFAVEDERIVVITVKVYYHSP